MSTLKSFLLALGILITAASANASLLIEPHVGYNLKGGMSSYTVNGITAKTEYKGPQYGARLGVKYLGFMGGFAYTHSTYDLDIVVPAFGTFTGAQKQDDMGLFVGYNAPILIRAWVAYYFSSKMTQTADGTPAGGGGTSGDWMKGKTTEIGLGFTPLPLLSLNLSYRMSTFDKDEDGTLADKYKPTEIVLGVSLPFSFL